MEQGLYQNNLRSVVGPRPALTPTRARERVVADRAAIDAVLDEALTCHVALVVDGRPHALPTLHVRIGDTLYVHGSVAARLLAAARRQDQEQEQDQPAGLPVCVTVSLLDGIVFARSAFHHSLNYRSVVVHADAQLVTDEETARAVLAALVDRVGEDRSAGCRPPSRKELAATAVLAVPLDEARADVALKRRTGPPVDDDEDLALPYWAGVVPLALAAGPPLTDAASAVAVPAGLAPGLTCWPG